MSVDLAKWWRYAEARDRRDEREQRTVALTDDDLLEILGELDPGHELADPDRTYGRRR